MIRRLLRFLSLRMTLLFIFAFVGCSGGNSGSDAVGGEEIVLVPQTFEEKCVLCHRLSSIADVEEVHAKETNSPEGEITSVAVDGAGMVTVDFMLFESENNLIPIGDMSASSIRFTLAKLVPGSKGDADMWVNYINRTETVASDTPGNSPDGTPTPEGTSYVQATSERASTSGGVFTNNGDGSYSYQFSFAIDSMTDPVAVSYEPNLTHRVAMQVSDNVANAYYDFVPNGGPLPNTRDIVINDACNQCHIKLGFHGGDRIQVAYCVTCHNPGTTDANSGNTVDFKVMVHKIHMGEDLPSVQDFGWEYAIWGHNDSKVDFSEVFFPRDIRFPGLGEAETTCMTCHESGDATDSDNWNMVPTQEACTSCHDTTSFAGTVPDGFTQHTGGAMVDNSQCASCHLPTGGVEGVIDAHIIPAMVAAQSFEYNIISVTDSEGGPVDPGDLVKVTFSVTDPTNYDAPYDILNDPSFTGGRLSILIGWDTKDIHNTGSGNELAQPLSNDTLSTATDNMDGTFSVISDMAIPEEVVGSGMVALQGRLAGDFDGDGTYSDRVSPTNVVMSFPIAGASVEDRRVVVDVNNCNSCHGQLSLHGGNRTDEPQVCIMCHNPNATDYEVRPGDDTTVDRKIEEAIDFKYMIHAIHGGSDEYHGMREKGIVVYGHGGSIHDFSRVVLPSGTDNLRNCAGCHDGSTFMVPLGENVLPTTIRTGDYLDDPDDDTNITPTAAVCSSCHDSIEAKTHMAEYGGQFDFVAFTEEVASDSGGGSQEELCAPGPISTQPAGHSERFDCCSCHSPH